MFDLDDQEAREVGRNPFLVEGIGLLLLDAVVARQMKALRVVRLQIRIRRRGAKSRDVIGVVAVEDHERVADPGVFVEILRDEHVRADEDVAPPEFR